MIFDYFVMQMR